ncbi:unnamed protein product, partial [Prorocentrum cordatum]
VCKRLGLGYLVAWLMESHRAGTRCVCRDSHFAFATWLRSKAGLRQRRQARDWLVTGAAEVVPSPGATFEELLDLERVHRPAGEFFEPEEIAG